MTSFDGGSLLPKTIPNVSLVVVSSGDIETGGYALLTYVARGDWSSALPVVKWLSAQRNSLGGFSSTQGSVSQPLLLLLINIHLVEKKHRLG